MSEISGRKIVDSEPNAQLKPGVLIAVDSAASHDSQAMVTRIPATGDLSSIFSASSSVIEFIVGNQSDIDVINQLALCLNVQASAGAGNTVLSGIFAFTDHIELYLGGKMLDQIYPANLVSELLLLPDQQLQSIGPMVGLLTNDPAAAGYMLPNVTLAPSGTYKFILPLWNTIFEASGFSPRYTREQMRVRWFFNNGQFAAVSNSAKAGTTLTATLCELMISGKKYSPALRQIKDAQRAGQSIACPCVVRRTFQKNQGTLVASQQQTETLSYLNGRFIYTDVWLSKPVSATCPEALYQKDYTNSLSPSSWNLDTLSLDDSSGRPCEFVDNLSGDFVRLSLGSYQQDNQAHTAMRHYPLSFTTNLTEEYWNIQTKEDRYADGLYTFKYTPDASVYTGGASYLNGVGLQSSTLVVGPGGEVDLLNM